MTEIVPTPEVASWCLATLAQQSLTPSRYEALAAEASHRSFWRLHAEGNDRKETFVLMVSPPELERNDAFEATADLFFNAGIPVPCIIAQDPSRGLYLQSDVGTTHLADLYDTPQEDEAIAAAIDVLAKLQRVTGELPVYSKSVVETELEIFVHWFVPWAAQSDPVPFDAIAFAQTCTPLVDTMLGQPLVSIHLDYHSRNLIYEQGQIGIVDFQDARRGPIFYDLACLLHDCYYTFPEHKIDHWLRYYLERAGSIVESMTFDAARRALDLTGLQRQLKAIGIFARLDMRDGKQTHLQYIPNNLARAKNVCSRYDELTPLAHVLEPLLAPLSS